MAKKKTSQSKRGAAGVTKTAKKTAKKARKAVKKVAKAARKAASGKSTAKRSTAKSKSTSKAKSTTKKAAAKKSKTSKRSAPAKTSTTRKQTTARKTSKKPAASPKKATTRKKIAKRPAAPASASSPTAASAETGSKPRKRSAKLTPKDIENFRQLLLEKRAQILGDVNTLRDEATRHGDSSGSSTMPIHMADLGTDNYEQEFTLRLIEDERAVLREIEEALQRIDDGTYGICIATGQPIGKARLRAKPWARYSYEYTLAQERGHR